MSLESFLKKQKATILEKWHQLILETYPSGTATLMGKDKNQFTNPVGSTILREIETLFDGLLQETGFKQLSTSLDAILKIRSIQDFSPSQAVGFIFLLKKAIEETLKGESQKGSFLEEWLKFQSKIDELALLAFDIYMDCREKICEIRVHQAKTEKEMAFRMMERMTHPKEK